MFSYWELQKKASPEAGRLMLNKSQRSCLRCKFISGVETIQILAKAKVKKKCLQSVNEVLVIYRS